MPTHMSDVITQNECLYGVSLICFVFHSLCCWVDHDNNCSNVELALWLLFQDNLSIPDLSKKSITCCYNCQSRDAVCFFY